jgi:hypothetical protein
MLSVGSRARRFSPSQDIHLKTALPAMSVMYITDTTPSISSQSELRQLISDMAPVSWAAVD